VLPGGHELLFAVAVEIDEAGDSLSTLATRDVVPNAIALRRITQDARQ